MTTFRSSLLVALVWSSVGALSAQAPLQGRQGQKQDRRFSLDVVVAGKDGVPVAGLGQKDFVLKDNKSAVPITQFKAVAAEEGVTEVILVIDAVNVNFIHLADERGRVERFLKANETLPVPTALAVFTDDGMQLQDGFSTNGKELSDVLDHFVTGIRTTRRSTEFQEQDRFNLSIKAFTELIGREGTRPGRKLIFWVSPGWPLLSGPGINLTGKQQDGIFHDIAGFATQMLKARITLYSLNPLGVEEGVGRVFYYQDFLKGVTKPGQAEIGDLSLQVLATQSGGLVLNSSNDLERELRTCFAETKASYFLSFEGSPGEAENEYHHLEVVVGEPGLTARTKSAYYAQP